MASAEFQGDALPPPPPPPQPRPRPRPGAAHAGLRIVLFALGLTSVVVMLQSKQTVYVSVPGVPYPVPVQAKWTQSPAFVYFVVAMSIVGLYGLITAIAALCFALKKTASRAGALLVYLIWDVVMLGLVASTAGTAGATAYIGFEGNKNAGWAKICDVYGTFCHRVAASIIISLIAGIVLIILIILSAHSLHRRVHK
ncbi:hypothetical protein MLD38_010705 [Melastoma candidum]|uniref:Uncharacterized protein n=1 Tax=Melastoma candidum TaxID=119954 RepID=A0ACB9R063_9MYRT|nr:hypothetical protein MLD38_010705 [Melastoma candidum]